MLQHLDWINRPRKVYWLALEDRRKTGRHTPAKNNGFSDVQYVPETFASSEQAEIKE